MHLFINRSCICHFIPKYSIMVMMMVMVMMVLMLVMVMICDAIY